jgi:hypothetical protein
VKHARLLFVVLLMVLCGLQWRSLRAMRAEISQLREKSAAESSRYVVSQFSETRRDELKRMVAWLDAFYRAPEGLGRAGGVCIDNRLDAPAIEQLLDPYLLARVRGDSEETARQKIVDAVKGTAEWQAKQRP